MFERKKEKQVKNPSRHRFKFICIFSDPETGKSGEFLTVASDLGNTLVARKINLVYGEESRVYGEALQFLQV